MQNANFYNYKKSSGAFLFLLSFSPASAFHFCFCSVNYSIYYYFSLYLHRHVFSLGSCCLVLMSQCNLTPSLFLLASRSSPQQSRDRITSSLGPECWVPTCCLPDAPQHLATHAHPDRACLQMSSEARNPQRGKERGAQATRG